MAPRGNNLIPNGHFHKNWQKFTKCWFSQPFRKERRHKKRIERNRKQAPRPIGPLRPIVHCPSFRYNKKIRPGRGFTLDEIRNAGMSANYARTIGIAVDHRRRNKSTEMLLKNTQRLKEYRQRLILFPIKKGKTTQTEEMKMAKQVDLDEVFRIGSKTKRLQVMKINRKMRKFNAFTVLRQATTEAKALSKRNKSQSKKNDLEAKI